MPPPWRKRRTATEHATDVLMQHMTGTATEEVATQNITGTATEHAAAGSKAINDVQTDRADNSLNNLVVKLAEFLTYVLQDLWNIPGFDDEHTRGADFCIDIVYQKIGEWAKWVDPDGRAFYTETELLLHKQMWDLVTRDKDGNEKDHYFTDWCRRVASHSSVHTPSIATEHAAADSSDELTASFRSLVQDMFRTDLTEEQKQNPVYRLHKDGRITTKQRSWVNMMLRKNLGDSRVCEFILNHGIPKLLDVPLRFTKTVDNALLQNMLDEFMTWHASLLQSIQGRKDEPHMAIARRLSDLDQKQWQQQRREKMWEVKQQIKEGEFLAKQRDRGKRKFEDMSEREQQTLEDLETQKLKREYDSHCVRKPPRFHGKML